MYFACILLRFPMCLKQRAEWEMEEVCDISSVKHLDRKTLGFLYLLPSKNKRIYSLVLHQLKFTVQDGYHPKGREQSYFGRFGNLVSQIGYRGKTQERVWVLILLFPQWLIVTYNCSEPISQNKRLIFTS